MAGLPPYSVPQGNMSSSSNFSDRKPLPRPPTNPWSLSQIKHIGTEKLLKHNIPLWKPYTLRAPFLLFVILLTIVFIVSIELLLNTSQRNGALTFAEGDLSLWQTFISQYMATVASIMYGICLGLIDLDAKRLEPYFQLSKEGGADAKDSLLLHYPFDFLAFVPFTALKRRHWSVFCIGTSVVLVFWVITPLQSSLIGQTTLNRALDTGFHLTSNLSKVSDQRSCEFMYNAYSMAWLGADPPAFMTNDTTFLPFVIDAVEAQPQDETWVGTTTAYSAYLDCRNATIIEQTSTSANGTIVPTGQKYFTDQKTNCTFIHPGFVVDGNFRPYYAEYIGYHSGLTSSWYLQTDTCDLGEDSQLFLLIVSKQNTSNDIIGLNAMYCATNYEQYTAQIHVLASSGQIQQVFRTSEATILSDDQFNATVLEDILSGYGLDYSASSSSIFNTGPQSGGFIQNIQDQLSNDLQGESGILAFLFCIESDLSKLLNPAILAPAWQKAYQLLFANYVNSVLLQASNSSMLATRVFQAEAVVVIVTYARLLQGFLSAVTVLMVAFLVFSLRRKSNLLYDPSSLAASMALVAGDDEGLKSFNNLETCSSEVLGRSIYQGKFQLSEHSEKRNYGLVQSASPITLINKTQITPGEHKKFSPVVFKIPIGVLFVALLLAILVFLTYLFWFAQHNQGLPTISNNAIVFQIFYSYIPTVIATFMEPFWTLLTRTVAVLQPFIALKARNSTPARSISLKYTSVPPALLILTSLKARHFFLATLAGVSFSTNILAVSLSGLFSVNTVDITTKLNFTQSLGSNLANRPILNPIPIIYATPNGLPSNSFSADSFDHYYIALANVTQDTPLPAWVTQNYYFLPFALSNDTDSTISWTGQTRGYGADLVCENLELNITNYEYNFQIPKKAKLGANMNVQFNVPSSDGKKICTENYNYTRIPADGTSTDPTLIATEIFPLLGLEGDLLYLDLYPTSGIYNHSRFDDECASLFPAAFFRTVSTPTVETGTNDSLLEDFSYKAIICRPQVKIALFDVTVDSNNKVLAYDQATAFTNNTELFFSNVTQAQFMGAFRLMMNNANGHYPSFIPSTFHPDASTLDWNTYFLKTFLNSSNIVDPNKAIPDMSLVGDALGDMYRRLFAIVLGQYSDQIYSPQTKNLTVPGNTAQQIRRVQISYPMFYITGSLLAVYIFVAIYLYAYRANFFLPRVPTSIASIVAFFYDSQALQDVKGTELLSTTQRDDFLERQGYKYGYGWFSGRSMEKRLGLEREPLLSSLD